MKNSKEIITLGTLEREYHNKFGPNKYADYLLFRTGKCNKEKREYLLDNLSNEAKGVILTF